MPWSGNVLHMNKPTEKHLEDLQARRSAPLATRTDLSQAATKDIAGALNGITRNTVFAICEDLGLKLVEKRITRDEVYICDEAFFTGTAAEVTPIRELDRIELGAGSRGPITEKIQSAFFDIVNGRNPKYAEWLTKV